jgi:hypothetical protein
MHKGTQLKHSICKQNTLVLLMLTRQIDWLLLRVHQVSTSKVTSKRDSFLCVFCPFMMPVPSTARFYRIYSDDWRHF